MGYLILNKRQRTGKVLAFVTFHDDSFIQLIKLAKPYKDGTQFAIHETTMNPQISNKLFENLSNAFDWYYFFMKNEIQENNLKKSYFGNELENLKHIKENGPK